MHDPRPPLWSGLSDEEHEFQYNPQRAFPNFADHQAERAPANTSARTNLKSHLDVPYGEHPLRRVDVFPADGAARTPVHVFFHGGYWRAQDKENFTFVARELVARGVTTVIANYELCPASTLDGVVDSALTAIEWICRHIADYGATRTASACRATLPGRTSAPRCSPRTGWRAASARRAFWAR